jgi:hypothetical protein
VMLYVVSTLSHESPLTTVYHLLQFAAMPDCVGPVGPVGVAVTEVEVEIGPFTQYASPNHRLVHWLPTVCMLAMDEEIQEMSCQLSTWWAKR